MIERSARKVDGPTKLGPLRFITLDMHPKGKVQPYVPKSSRTKSSASQVPKVITPKIPE